MVYLRKSILLAVLFLAVSGIAFAAALDDNAWRVEITPEGSAVPHFVDQISFQKDSFNSSIFARKGFPSVAFTQSKDASGMTIWEANQQGKEESLAWHGQLKGEEMTGTLIWKKPDGSSVTYALLGSPFVEETEEVAASAGAAPKTAGKKSWFGCSLVLE